MRFTTLFFAAAVAMPAAAATDPAFDALVQAERDFAADSPKLGVTLAFAKHMAPDAILFRPTPIEARVLYKDADKAPRPPVKLDWGPSHAEIAASGDMGYTFGPARYEIEEGAKDREGKPVPAGVSHTTFFSIWVRDANGIFGNVMDQGVGNPGLQLPNEVVRLGPSTPANASVRATPADHTARLQQLLLADRRLSAALAGDAHADALIAAAVPDAWVLREGVGAVSIAQAPAQPKRPTTDLAAIRISAAGDFGATSGYGGDPRRPHTYQRAWRWDGDAWKVTVDLQLDPAPAK